MIFYHFRDLTDYLGYLKGGEFTYVNLDVEEVTTKESLDYYAILTTYSMEKDRIYVCVQKIGSHQKYAAHVQGAAKHLGSEEDPASKKMIEAQKKADEKSKDQQKAAMVREFKTMAAGIYPEVEFSESERRWSTEPSVHLPTSVEEVEVVDSGGPAEEGATAGTKSAEGPEKKQKPAPKSQEKPEEESGGGESGQSQDKEAGGASEAKEAGAGQPPTGKKTPRKSR